MMYCTFHRKKFTIYINMFVLMISTFFLKCYVNILYRQNVFFFIVFIIVYVVLIFVTNISVFYKKKNMSFKYVIQ